MLKKWLSGLLLLAGLVANTTLLAGDLPDFEASYILKRGSLRIGSSNIELRSDNNGSYVYESHSWPTRWVAWLLKDRLHESSRGIFIDGSLRPDNYHYLRTGGSREREADLSFDWKKNRVKNHVEGSLWEMEIPTGTVDKLASQLGMMLALRQDKDDVTFKVADGGRLKEYRFKVIGHETVEVPAGTFETVKITKLRDNKDRVTYVWCAPALNYLPVRIWQRETDDAEYTSDLEKFSEALRVQ
jgi:hypothetical protein